MRIGRMLQAQRGLVGRAAVRMPGAAVCAAVQRVRPRVGVRLQHVGAAAVVEPGVTTARALTSISGRGVGMDVVRRCVDALSGRIEITSTLGKGTTFTIELPIADDSRVGESE